MEECSHRPVFENLASQAAHRTGEEEGDGAFDESSHAQEGQNQTPISIARSTARYSTPTTLSVGATRLKSSSSVSTNPHSPSVSISIHTEVYCIRHCLQPLTPLPITDDESGERGECGPRQSQQATRRTASPSRIAMVQGRRSTRISSLQGFVAQDISKTSRASTFSLGTKDGVDVSATRKRKRRKSTPVELDIRGIDTKREGKSGNYRKRQRSNSNGNKRARPSRVKASKWKLPKSFGHNNCDDSDFKLSLIHI